MNGILAFVLAVLVYPGLLVAGLAALALGWARDSARGALANTGTPHPLKSVQQVRGALQRDTIAPEGVYPLALTLTSTAAVLFPVAALVLLPVPGNPLVQALSLQGDLIAEGGLLLGLPLTRLAVGWAIPSPFTRLAADRGARLLAGAAVPMILAFTASAEQVATLGLNFPVVKGSLPLIAVVTRILAALAFIFALPVLARASHLRADDDEELELVAGELTELSGRDLALFRIGESLQLVAVAAVFVAAFVLPIFATLPMGAGRGILWIVGLIVTAAGIGLWEGFASRQPATANDRPPLTWWVGWPVLVALLALVAAAWATRAG